jgi:anti-sigma B factor antagonist
MNISAQQVGDMTVVIASGELDMAVADQFRARLHDVISAGAAQMVVDLTSVTFVDSTILGVLVGARNQLGHDGDRLRIVCSNAAVLKTFRLTGLDEVFAIRGSLAEIERPA